MKLSTNINCPGCSRKMAFKVEDMIPGRMKTCPTCRSEIRFTGDDGRKTQKAINDFEKSLKNMFK